MKALKLTVGIGEDDDLRKWLQKTIREQFLSLDRAELQLMLLDEVSQRMESKIVVAIENKLAQSSGDIRRAIDKEANLISRNHYTEYVSNFVKDNLENILKVALRKMGQGDFTFTSVESTLDATLNAVVLGRVEKLLTEERLNASLDRVISNKIGSLENLLKMAKRD